MADDAFIHELISRTIKNRLRQEKRYNREPVHSPTIWEAERAAEAVMQALKLVNLQIIPNPQTSNVVEKIVSVATVYMGNVIVLPPPARHHDIVNFIGEHFHVPDGEGIGPEQQGFMTSSGRFVDRVTAKRIAIGANQILPMREGQTTRYVGPDLFSEDVW